MTFRDQVMWYSRKQVDAMEPGAALQNPFFESTATDILACGETSSNVNMAAVHFFFIGGSMSQGKLETRSPNA